MRRRVHHPHTRYRLTAFVGLLALVGLGLAFVPGTAHATTTTITSNFQLDGDIASGTNGNFSTTTGYQAPHYDWTSFLQPNATTGDVSTQTGALPGGYINVAASPDYVLPDSTVYATGSKDTLPISGWQCTQKNNIGAKDDLMNVYQAAYIDSTTHDLIVFFGAEKSSNLGDNNIAIWLLQDGSVNCSSAGGTTTWTGSHQTGDILLAAAFTNGGTQANIVAYEWENGALVQIASSDQECDANQTLPPSGGDYAMCAITNDGQISVPWNAPAKTQPGGTGYLAPEEFYEGGMDVTQLLNGNTAAQGATTPCFNTTVTDTRSSQSDTATLFDFARQHFETCGGTNMNVTPATASPSTIHSGGSTTLTFYETNTGTVPLTSPGVTAYTTPGGGPGTTTLLADCNSSMTLASGDANSNGVLDPDETFAYQCTTTSITSTSTVTAVGHGLDPTGANVTFCGGALTSDVSGTDVTTLPVTSLTHAIKSGDTLRIGSGSSAQTVTASADAVAGATSISIDAFSPASTIPKGTFVGDTVYPCNADEVTTVGVTVINPSTQLTETASALVTYTFTETNNGDSALTSPSVSDPQCSGGSATYKSGDANSNGKLDPGESWVYTCTATVNGPTTDTGSTSVTDFGTGHGTDVTGADVTFCATGTSTTGKDCTTSEQDGTNVAITNLPRGSQPPAIVSAAAISGTSQVAFTYNQNISCGTGAGASFTDTTAGSQAGTAISCSGTTATVTFGTAATATGDSVTYTQSSTAADQVVATDLAGSPQAVTQTVTVQ